MSHGDHTPDDPIPKLLAEVDQLAAEAPIRAKIVRAVFDALVAEGFDQAPALYLTVAMVSGDPGRPAA